LDQGYFNNLVLGTYKILKSAEARVVFFENVQNFFHSATYHDLRDDYPHIIGPIQLESYDFGSIALRNRSYAVYFQENVNTYKSAMPSTICGIISGDSIKDWSACFPRKSRRAIP
jgi:DNA (cytosine-5)-methyltransferase 1